MLFLLTSHNGGTHILKVNPVKTYMSVSVILTVRIEKRVLPRGGFRCLRWKLLEQ